MAEVKICNYRIAEISTALRLRVRRRWNWRQLAKGAITSKIKHAIKLTGRYAVVGCKLKQNANGGCNSCASLAGFVLCFIACFI